jgi:hypothetical protein
MSEAIPEWGPYGFRIELTGKGYCIKSNSPSFRVGQHILTIERVVGNTFWAKQVYTDGVWRRIHGEKVSAHELSFYGIDEPYVWSMFRWA